MAFMGRFFGQNERPVGNIDPGIGLAGRRNSKIDQTVAGRGQPELPLAAVALGLRRARHADPREKGQRDDRARRLCGQTSRPWQCLNFLPDPQGQGSFRPGLPQVV